MLAELRETGEEVVAVAGFLVVVGVVVLVVVRFAARLLVGLGRLDAVAVVGVAPPSVVRRGGGGLVVIVVVNVLAAAGGTGGLRVVVRSATEEVDVLVRVAALLLLFLASVLLLLVVDAVEEVAVAVDGRVVRAATVSLELLRIVVVVFVLVFFASVEEDMFIESLMPTLYNPCMLLYYCILCACDDD